MFKQCSSNVQAMFKQCSSNVQAMFKLFLWGVGSIFLANPCHASVQVDAVHWIG